MFEPRVDGTGPDGGVELSPQNVSAEMAPTVAWLQHKVDNQGYPDEMPADERDMAFLILSQQLDKLGRLGVNVPEHRIVTGRTSSNEVDHTLEVAPVMGVGVSELLRRHTEPFPAKELVDLGAGMASYLDAQSETGGPLVKGSMELSNYSYGTSEGDEAAKIYLTKIEPHIQNVETPQATDEYINEAASLALTLTDIEQATGERCSRARAELAKFRARSEAAGHTKNSLMFGAIDAYLAR